MTLPDYHYKSYDIVIQLNLDLLLANYKWSWQILLCQKLPKRYQVVQASAATQQMKKPTFPKRNIDFFVLWSEHKY